MDDIVRIVFEGRLWYNQQWEPSGSTIKELVYEG
jgi:hypothetical protein